VTVKRHMALWSGLIVVAVGIVASLLLGIGRPLLYISWAIMVAFIVYAARNIPRRYRWHGPGQVNEATDNRFGRFGRSYREEPLPASSRVGRNAPCPCGSGLKNKQCCGIQ